MIDVGVLGVPAVVTTLPWKCVFRFGDTFSRRTDPTAGTDYVVLSRPALQESAPTAALSFPRLTWAEQIMKFEAFTGNRRSRRQNLPQAAPAIVESLETRALLAAPQVLTPTGTISDSTPVITWEAVDGAISYDLWVSDVEVRKVIFTEYGLGTTSYTVTTELHLGRNRIWVQANFEDGTSTGWGPLKDVILQVAPNITGPTNLLQPATPGKINETQPTITWTSPPAARSFEIFFSDQTRLTSTTYRVTNLTAQLDADGNTIPDGNGDVLREEIRAFELPSELLMGQYRVFMRSTDFGGRVSAWSAAFNFEIAPAVTTLRPSGPSFQNPALLEWSPVAGATHYEVWVSRVGLVNELTAIYNPKFLTTTSYQIPAKLAAGDYVFFVRAKLRTTGRPDVIGLWSARKEFGPLQKPVITGPVGLESDNPEYPTVTNARPTIEWTAIDKAARYEIWVDRTASSSTYLLADSPTNSYTFETDIQSGKYFVWVRAISTTGVVTAWSEPYKFTATGGAPLITEPVNNAVVEPIPDIVWAGVAEADHYEIHIAWINVDFDFIVATTNETTFAPEEALEVGTYRVWVRAIKADGTALPWSAPVTFYFVNADRLPELPAGNLQLEVLTSLLRRDTESDETVPVADAAVTVDATGEEQTSRNSSERISRAARNGVQSVETPAWPVVAEAELIEKLAQACTTGEWWSVI